MVKKIIPVILTKSAEALKIKLQKLQGLAAWAQIDIADGRFVNNKTLGLQDLVQIKSNLKLEAHLMVLNPEKYLVQAKKARIKRVIFHFEAVKNILGTLKKIERIGLKNGLALNPETPVEKIKPYLNKIDLVLLMGVHPGFGGQKFISSTISKIKKLRAMDKKIKIEVDGGIDLSSIKKISQAGADYLVVGTCLFDATDVKKKFKQLRERLTFNIGCK